MTHRRRSRPGFTLVEVLVALSVIAIAFASLGFVQLTNLRASSTARVATETKNAANAVLERVLAQVLVTETNACTPGDPPSEPYCDTQGTYYSFNDFFWSCPTPVSPTGAALAVRNGNVACSGSETVVTPSGHDVVVAFGIAGMGGIAGEGVLAVSVTATHQVLDGVSVTIGDRITCYDVYPTPTASAPAPCPVPTTAGSGRP